MNILGIFPHPKIVRDLRTLLDDIAREDDVNRTRMNSKKKGIKKAPVKRSGVCTTNTNIQLIYIVNDI